MSIFMGLYREEAETSRGINIKDPTVYIPPFFLADGGGGGWKPEAIVEPSGPCASST